LNIYDFQPNLMANDLINFIFDYSNQMKVRKLIIFLFKIVY